MGLRRGVKTRSTIYTATLTLADTWYKVAGDLNANGTVIAWYMKPRENTSNEFDYAYKDDPADYLTNSGQGVSNDTDLREIWARSPVSGTVMELEVKVEV